MKPGRWGSSRFVGGMIVRSPPNRPTLLLRGCTRARYRAAASTDSVHRGHRQSAAATRSGRFHPERFSRAATGFGGLAAADFAGQLARFAPRSLRLWLVSAALRSAAEPDELYAAYMPLLETFGALYVNGKYVGQTGAFERISRTAQLSQPFVPGAPPVLLGYRSSAVFNSPRPSARKAPTPFTCGYGSKAVRAELCPA